ncbi:MAG: hypothetical protein QUV02_02370 [Maricaulis sp.]|uniref:hypothetical protein n=1 Tax=Maricaulis sp. TaxID=1486257 RepID=UPI00263355D2|nr:hypothetical protein [Maricaulis sp.]MDM7983267.1 hypothetical protein [Maricaulis sp.]
MTDHSHSINAPADIPDDKQLKRIAELTLREPKEPPYYAVSRIIPEEEHAKAVTHYLYKDADGRAELEDEQTRLIEEYGEEAFLPGKCDLLRRLFEIANTPSVEAKDQVAALDKYARIAGYDKPKEEQPDTIVTHVMYAPAPQSLDEWGAKASTQQSRVHREAQESETVRQSDPKPSESSQKTHPHRPQPAESNALGLQIGR